MAVRHIREAYNQEAGETSTCQSAFLDYIFRDGQQRQVITLKIIDAAGVPHTIQTPVHDMKEDPHEQVRELARTFKIGPSAGGAYAFDLPPVTEEPAKTDPVVPVGGGPNETTGSSAEARSSPPRPEVERPKTAGGQSSTFDSLPNPFITN